VSFQIAETQGGAPILDFTDPDVRAAFKATDNMQTLGDWINIPVPEIDFLVEGLIEAGTLVMIAAEEGTGKSIVLTSIAHQVSIGGEFLGFKCNRAPVIYYVLDEPERNFKRRLHNQGKNNEGGFIHYGELSTEETTTDNFIKRLLYRIEYSRHEYGGTPAVFLDTMADALDIEELNNHSEVVSKLGKLREVIRKTGCTIVMTHHYNKNTQANTRNRVTGAKGIRSKCDTVFDLLFSDPDDSQSPRTLETSKVRMTPHLPKTMLDYDHETMTVTVSGIQLTQEQRESKEKDDKIIAAIEGSKDGLCNDELAAAVSIPVSTLKRHLPGLQRTGKIEQGDKGKGKGRCRAWRLPAPQPSGADPVTL
jgi:RecA-family ATPase